MTEPTTQQMPPTVVVANTTYRLPYADLLPPLGDNELKALRSDIARRRCVLVPVVMDEGQNVIDGANRLRIAVELGITDVPVEIRAGLSEAEKSELAEDLNLHRRHLTRKQMREIISARLTRAPNRSNNSVALALGVTDKTVAKVRRDLEATSEIPKLDRTIGADGKARRTAVIRGLGLRQAPRVAGMVAEIAAAAAIDPQRHGPLLDAMSRTGRVSGVYRNLGVSRLADKIVTGQLPVPHGRFRVIAADPPWHYDARFEDPSHRSASPYPQMSTEEICAVPVADYAYDDCVLWLWTTNAHLPQAFDVLQAWGFSYRTTLTWSKDRLGLGNWLRGQTEHCLMAVRGRPVVVLSNQSTLLHAPVSAHSRKPPEFYKLVESLCPVPPGGRLELFAREEREGWVTEGVDLGEFSLGDQMALESDQATNAKMMASAQPRKWPGRVPARHRPESYDDDAHSKRPEDLQ